MNDSWQSLKNFFSQATADRVLNMAGSLVLLALGFVAIRWTLRIVDRSLRRSRLDVGVVSFLNSLASVGLKVLLIFAVAIQLGVPSASFVTLMGSAGLAIGLALQGSLSNLAGGFMILLFHPFRVGHYIKTGTDDGVVRDIGIFYTTLETFDNKTVVLPNGMLSNNVITNFSSSATRRIDIHLSVSPRAEVDAVNALMRQVAESHPNVIKDRKIEARLNDIKDGVLVFVLRAWVKQADMWDTRLDLNEGLKRAFDGAGIAFAAPQLQVLAPKE